MDERGIGRREPAQDSATITVVRPDECIFELETGVSRSYGELLELKEALLAEPVWSGIEVVNLCCEQRFNFLAALLASAELGLVVKLAPRNHPHLGPNLPSLRITDQDSGVERPPAHARTISKSVGERKCELAVEPLVQKISANKSPSLEDSFDLSLLRVEFWTSGSSDEPRSFAKHSGQLLSETTTLRQFWDVRRGERLLCSTPPHHIYGFLWGVLLPLLSGASLVSASPRHGQSICEAIQKAEPSRLVSVPAQLAALLSVLDLSQSHALSPNLRIVSSGAPLSRELATRLEAHGASVLEVLGSTETGGIAWRRPNQEETFRPLPGVLVTSSETGVLLVDSAHLPDGDRPFATTDLIEMQNGGFLHLGRADSIVKIGANRVSLREVEERALRVPGIMAFRAIALEARDSLTHSLELCAVAVAPGHSIPLLRAALLAALPPELWPKRIRRVAAMPLDDRGKVTVAALAALFGEPRSSPAPLTVSFDAKALGTGQQVANLVVSVPGNASCLEGHFPSDPMVPGAVLLQEAILGPVVQLWPDVAAPITFENVRFERALRAFDRATVTLTRKDQRVDFRIAIGPEIAVRGACSFKTRDR